VSSISGGDFPEPEPDFEEERMRTPWTKYLAECGYDGETDQADEPVAESERPTWDVEGLQAKGEWP